MKIFPIENCGIIMPKGINNVNLVNSRTEEEEERKKKIEYKVASNERRLKILSRYLFEIIFWDSFKKFFGFNPC